MAEEAYASVINAVPSLFLFVCLFVCVCVFVCLLVFFSSQDRVILALPKYSGKVSVFDNRLQSLV